MEMISGASSADLCQERFEALRAAYPGRRLLIVSNTSGAQSYDKGGKLASEVEKSTGVAVLSHRVKKPGCADEIIEYFRQHPETGVTGPHQIAVVGDRLFTDMMLANRMGSWGIWVKDGVVPLKEKSIVSVGLQFVYTRDKILTMYQFSRMEQKVGPFLMARGLSPSEPTSPFE
jgi:phosphatidylglycerophosphatase GEP4